MSGAFYELRRYRTRPGRREEWVRYMEDVVIPFQSAAGMDVIASFVDEQDEDAYVWIRRFDDEEQRLDRYAAVYGSPRWTDEIAPVVRSMLLVDESVVTRAVPTPASGLR